jgi:myo-inositol 2-dehydrogenase/D-chiro-inositol 1-dehydrogenase
MKKPTKPEVGNRRSFIKSTAAVAAATSFAPRIAGAFAGGSDEIKIGLIGCGGKGNSDIRQALTTDGKAKLWALGDAFDYRVQGTHKAFAENEKFKDKTDCKDRLFTGMDAYKKVIDSGVDVVFLVTAPGWRPVHYQYAIEQGKHVFMQKPCAIDAKGVRILMETTAAAEKKGLKVGVGFQRRHDPRYIETVQKLHDGAIGELLSFRAYWDGRTPWVRSRADFAKQLGREPTELEYQTNNWYYFNWLCGDHILEQHIHNLDVCNWVMGQTPTAAQGKGGCEVRKGLDYGETFDHHVVEYSYGKWDTGSRLHSSCRHQPDCWGNVSEQVQGTNGFCLISGGKIYDLKGNAVWKAEGNGNSEQIHKDAFLAAIRDNTPFNEGDYGATSSMTAIFGRMATYSGKLLRWDECIKSEVDVFPYGQENWDWNTKPPVLPDANGLFKLPIPGVTKVV